MLPDAPIAKTFTYLAARRSRSARMMLRRLNGSGVFFMALTIVGCAAADAGGGGSGEVAQSIAGFVDPVALGFQEVSGRGSHRVFARSGVPELVNLQDEAASGCAPPALPCLGVTAAGTWGWAGSGRDFLRTPDIADLILPPSNRRREAT